VYIADTLNNRILKFSNDGKFQGSWGSAGKAKGQFAQPWGITVDIK
jgi:DNA-binding beta-propeller fold protein YncE